jgi:hypothetical protein
MATPGVDVIDQNGNRHTLPAAQAQEGIAGGYLRPASGTIQIVRGNEVRETTPDKLGEAESFGWALADDKGVESARIREEESGIAGLARGTAESAISGLTMGLADPLLAGDGEDAERYRARAKATGDFGEAVRLAGEVVPVLASGGTAAGAKGAAGAARAGVRGLGVIPRAVEAAGLVAEKGAARMLGRGTLGRTGGALARGAVEGAASGVGTEIRESVLGDREIATERLLASGAMGAVLGGGASAAFPLTGALLKRGAKVPREATQAMLGKVAKADPANMRKTAEWVETIASGRNFEPIKKQFDLLRTKEGRKLAFDALHNADEVASRTAQTVKDETASLAETLRATLRKTEADRSSSMRKLFTEADESVVPSAVRRDFEAAYERLDAEGYSLLEKYGDGEISRRHLDTFRGELERAWDDVVEGRLGAGDAHQRLLQAKRRAQELAKDVGRLDAKSSATSDLLRKVGSDLDSALARDEYGTAATAYREMRDADRSAMESFDRLFKRNRQTGAREGKNLLGRVLNGEATDADVLTFTKRVGNPRFADQADVADEYFERQIRAAEIRAKHTGDDSLRAEIGKLRTAQEKFRATLKKQARVADIIDANRSSGRGGLSGALAAFGPSGAAVSGAMLGGLPGMMVGAAINAAARPAQTIRTLAAIGHLADRTGVDLDGIVTRVTSAGKATKRAAGRAALKRRPRARGRSTAGGRTVATRAAAQGGVRVSSRAEEQDARVRRAAEMTDPEALRRELARDMSLMREHAPGIAEAAAEKVGVAAAFLAGKLPPSIPNPVTGAKRIIPASMRDKFDRYYEAVTNPVETLKKLDGGAFTLEHAEAIKAVYPAIYADMQGKVFAGLQAAADRGEEIPYARRIRLGILFGLPTDPTMTPEFQASLAAAHGETSAVEAAQELAAAPKPQAPDRARKVTYKAAGRYHTPIGRIESNR